MKKDAHHNDEPVTKGYLDHTLRYRFGRFHAKIKAEIREESHALEYRLTQDTNSKFAQIDRKFLQIDKRFDSLEKKVDDQTAYIKQAVNRVLELADQVIGVHKNFEAESASIKQNYEVLEERVKKVEVVVFPGRE